MKNSAKRVLLNASLYGAGGRETHLLNLCQVLRAEGTEITLVARYANSATPLLQQSRTLGVKVISTPFAGNPRWFRPSTAWARLAWPLLLEDESFDALYTYEVTKFTVYLSRFVKPEGWVIACRAGEPMDPASRPEKEVLDALDAFMVETPLQAEAVRNICGPNLAVASVPSLGHLMSVPARSRRFNDELRITYIGRYDRAKGIYRLLDIWGQLSIGPARLDYFGHGSEEQPMKEEILKRGFQDRVRINGAYSGGDLAHIMENSDLIVLPSETEGLPIVLLESMAYGVPFLATDVGAVRALADNNPDVRVVHLSNEAIAQGITEMAAGIRSGNIRGQRLQQYHRERYSHDLIARQWCEALLEPDKFWATKQTQVSHSEVTVV